MSPSSTPTTRRTRKAKTTAASAPLESEAGFQRAITDALTAFGYLWHHEPDSRRSNAGLPDLIAVGHGRCLFIEVKREDGRLRPAQREWKAALERCAGVEYYTVRPSQMALLLDTIRPAPRQNLQQKASA